jgi:hypothetical protein
VTATLHYIRLPGSPETLYWLEERTAEAMGRKPRLLRGIAAICMYSHNDYAISIRGEIRRCPTFTRGLIPELDYQLGEIFRGR